MRLGVKKRKPRRSSAVLLGDVAGGRHIAHESRGRATQRVRAHIIPLLEPLSRCPLRMLLSFARMRLSFARACAFSTGYRAIHSSGCGVRRCQLFGGAMSIWLPESFVDMSTMREIDDTEECWADAGVRI